MEDYFFKNNEKMYKDDLTEKGIELFKKRMDKKRKIKAYEINVKDFFSDDDENENIIKREKFGIINKFTNQRKIKLKKTNTYYPNSILMYKDQIQKKSTIDQTPNKKKERINFLIEDIGSKNTDKNRIPKKVTFPKDNFIIYVDIESYKKYNCLHSNKDAYSEDKIKSDSKCCTIF